MIYIPTRLTITILPSHPITLPNGHFPFSSSSDFSCSAVELPNPKLHRVKEKTKRRLLRVISSLALALPCFPRSRIAALSFSLSPFTFRLSKFQPSLFHEVNQKLTRFLSSLISLVEDVRTGCTLITCDQQESCPHRS
jgi:hypothetical protein